jgi:hypothetical protein
MWGMLRVSALESAQAVLEEQPELRRRRQGPTPPPLAQTPAQILSQALLVQQPSAPIYPSLALRAPTPLVTLPLGFMDLMMLLERLAALAVVLLGLDSSTALLPMSLHHSPTLEVLQRPEPQPQALVALEHQPQAALQMLAQQSQEAAAAVVLVPRNHPQLDLQAAKALAVALALEAVQQCAL